ncbi:MAG: sugar phosphate isomerase/epimerase family protein [Kiritimatiellia bacterium]|nr:sugar phosphate isomerase/epimerase [Lentisphaerota bacterium]
MQLAVSAIAWPAGTEREAFDLLSEHRITNLEYVPARINDADSLNARLHPYGLKLVALQALLYGTKGLALFQTPDARSALDRHLRSICVLAGQCGCRALVFGSPKNRRYDPARISPAAANLLAVDFFHDLGEFARAHGTLICLEPNPMAYGGNFLTGTLETADFVRRTGSPGISLNLDAGALMMNNEPPSQIWHNVCDMVGHVHLSTPFLKPPDNNSRPVHAELLQAMRRTGYAGAISLEMAAPDGIDWRTPLQRALTHIAEVFNLETAGDD